MSKVEELALSRLATIAAGPPPKSVETSVLRDIVADNKAPIHPSEPVRPQGVVGAGRVVTGNDGTGWTPARSIENWKPPGLAIMDRLMDQQDAIDRAEREALLRKLKKG